MGRSKAKAGKAKMESKSRKKAEDVPGFLPGLAPKRNAEIHKAAERLNDVLEEKGTINSKTKDLEAKLIEVMEKHGVDFYQFGKVKCKINIKKTVNVKEVGDEERNGSVSEDQGQDFPSDLDESAGETSAKKVNEEEEEPAATE